MIKLMNYAKLVKPQFGRETVVDEQASTGERKSRRAEPAGIGGWLALLIVWMVLLRPVAGVYMLNQLQATSLANPIILENSSWLINTSTFWMVFLLVAALSIYGGLRLWRDRTAASVRTVIVILWIFSPIAAVDLLIARAFLEGRVTLANATTTVVMNLAVAAAWTIYLKRSRRVRNTYLHI